ncbi:hypothetical protein BDZ91DRAFT_724810 [Kalaharituber pfeilii]|nr:hypothetical protein BDZ91DRAFT_724810 [Kalaharituber pfeilii]
MQLSFRILNVLFIHSSIAIAIAFPSHTHPLTGCQIRETGLSLPFSADTLRLRNGKVRSSTETILVPRPSEDRF